MCRKDVRKRVLNRQLLPDKVRFELDAKLLKVAEVCRTWDHTSSLNCYCQEDQSSCRLSKMTSFQMSSAPVLPTNVPGCLEEQT